MKETEVVTADDRTAKYSSYLKLRIHRKPMVAIANVCKKIGKLSVVYELLSKIVSKKKTLNQKYKYPVKNALIMYRLLIATEKSVVSRYKFNKLAISQLWVTKGESRGVRSIPRARGRSTPKYLPSTNVYIELKEIQ